MDLQKFLTLLDFKKKVSTKSLVLFTRQLATLIAAGLPLVKALRTLYDQLEPGALKGIIKTVADEVEGGSNFSEALSHFPKVFPDFYTPGRFEDLQSLPSYLLFQSKACCIPLLFPPAQIS